MADKKTLKEKVKSYVKTVKDLAEAGALGTGGVGWKKKKKEKEYVVDPDETVGGKRIRGVKGPEIKPAKRKTWQEIAGGGKNAPQDPLYPRRKGLGAALRGGGRAFNKGGKV